MKKNKMKCRINEYVRGETVVALMRRTPSNRFVG